MDNSSPNDLKKDQRNNWILPRKSKSFFSPETDPEIQEMTREFQKKGYKWLEQKVTYAGIK
jgi:hypothetical protein